MRNVRRLAMVLLALLLLALPAVGDAKRRHRAQPTAGGAALAADALGLKLLQRTPAGNSALSPWSIWTAVSMTHPGARGQTRAQIAKVLELRRVGHRPGVANRRLARALAESAGASEARLDVANALWAQEGAAIEAPYLNALSRDFGAPAQRVDFRGDSEGARNRINNWVLEHTNGKIADLFAPADITSLTRLVIANALYFKAKWQKPFNPDLTRDGVFHAPGGDVTVPTMHQRGSFRYARLPGLHAVGLPYRGDRLAMLILVPERGGLTQLQRKLNVPQLGTILAAMKPTEIELAMPRFHVEARLRLNESLSRLGMPRAFTDRAQFSGMSSAEHFQIQSVVHKVWIDVGEEGTEAAAATGISVGAVSAPPPAPRVDVDRPFLFLLGDRKTGAVLFMGRVENPAR